MHTRNKLPLNINYGERVSAALEECLKNDDIKTFCQHISYIGQYDFSLQKEDGLDTLHETIEEIKRLHSFDTCTTGMISNTQKNLRYHFPEYPFQEAA